jgi:hypothetical protein
LIRRQHSSGRTVAETCDRAGVTVPSYYAWKRKLGISGSRARKPRRPGSLVPIRVVLDRPAITSTVEIALPGNIAVRVPSGFDADTLSIVLAAVERLMDRERQSC